MALVRRPPAPSGPLPAVPPLVSCLTITRGRPDFLRQAVALFDRQTWPRKELVVVVDVRGDTSWVDAFFSEFKRDDLRWAVPGPVEHLGALRNVSIDMARGDFVCVWDDDDWYHPERVERQVRAALEEDVEACLLQDAMHYFADSGELFVIRWSRAGLPPSLLCRRTSMPRYSVVPDPEVGQRGSDTLVQKELLKRGSLVLLTEAPYLYSYVFHGENVWNRAHHIEIAFAASPTASEARPLLPGLRRRLAEYYPVEPPPEIVVNDGGRVSLE